MCVNFLQSSFFLKKMLENSFLPIQQWEFFPLYVMSRLYQRFHLSFSRYLNAIQTNAHHLLRYLAIVVVVNKRRRNMLKELIKVIQHEQYCYKDPIIEFLECLYVKYDFDGAQQKLMVCEQVSLMLCV
jgi:hypothetical protein